MAVKSPDLESILLLMILTTATGKYVYVPDRMPWSEAQTYCRAHYTDLAPVSNEDDQRFLNKMVAFDSYTWIGLMRNSTDREKWMWSGGTEVTECFWRLLHLEPNGITRGEDAGAIFCHSWVDIKPAYSKPFICYKVHAIRQRMTWEDALQYCRKNHHDLASVASETEMMLIEKELLKELSSMNVWIGLHFLAGEWLWVDGQPFKYESWGASKKPMCPDINFSCGALQVEGQKQEVNGITLTDAERILGWNAKNCNRERDFLCY